MIQIPSDCQEGLTLTCKEAEIVYSLVGFKFIVVRERDLDGVRPLLKKLEDYLKEHKHDDTVAI